MGFFIAVLNFIAIFFYLINFLRIQYLLFPKASCVGCSPPAQNQIILKPRLGIIKPYDYLIHISNTTQSVRSVTTKWQNQIKIHTSFHGGADFPKHNLLNNVSHRYPFGGWKSSEREHIQQGPGLIWDHLVHTRRLRHVHFRNPIHSNPLPIPTSSHFLVSDTIRLKKGWYCCTNQRVHASVQ